MNWLAQEPLWRLTAFVGVFSLIAAWEIVAPRRTVQHGKTYRWANNLGILVIDSLLLRLLFPAAAVGLPLLAQSRGWGILNQAAVAPHATNGWVVIACIVVLDLVVWAQHLALHKVPLLWRLHRMHHADVDIDVTTALRFHPLEILLSMVIKGAAIVVIGLAPITVLLFEILLNATAMFNHGNVRLAPGLDRLLRRVIVTPDMHRVHHSWHPDETNSNYGFNLPWWDRLFHTYRDQPRDGHHQMTIGLNQFREPRDNRLDRLLIQPFIGPTQSPPISAPRDTRKI